MEDIARQLEEAKERGIFEGRVLQALDDIKRSLVDITVRQTTLDAKIEQKLDKSAFDKFLDGYSKFSNKIYWFMGATSALSSAVTAIVVSYLKK